MENFNENTAKIYIKQNKTPKYLNQNLLISLLTLSSLLLITYLISSKKAYLKTHKIEIHDVQANFNIYDNAFKQYLHKGEILNILKTYKLSSLSIKKQYKNKIFLLHELIKLDKLDNCKTYLKQTVLLIKILKNIPQLNNKYTLIHINKIIFKLRNKCKDRYILSGIKEILSVLPKHQVSRKIYATYQLKGNYAFLRGYKWFKKKPSVAKFFLRKSVRLLLPFEKNYKIAKKLLRSK